MAMNGSSTAQINAPLDKVWKIVEDVTTAPQWQGGMDSITPEEKDAQGRATLCEAVADIKVRKAKSKIRFDYSKAPNELSWTQVKGDLKAVDGAWVLTDLGDGRTEATYKIEVDFGRILGAMVKGPAESAIRSLLVAARADELKKVCEES